MMTEKTTKGNKERTLTLKSGTSSPTSPKGSRSPSRVSTVVVESRRGKLSRRFHPMSLSQKVSKKILHQLEILLRAREMQEKKP